MFYKKKMCVSAHAIGAYRKDDLLCIENVVA